jgi:predicted HicB family RNase H-like nuclease
MDMTPTATMEQEGFAAAGTSQPTKAYSKNASKTAGEKIAAEMQAFVRVVDEIKNKLNRESDFEARCQQVVWAAGELMGLAPTWTAFYREILGKTGVVRTLFPSVDERLAYEVSEAHSTVYDALTALRSRDLPENDPTELQRMITIRLPMTLHDAICDEANDLKVSVNKLCISRMLQPLDTRMIPNCKNKRRGRRPGAAPIGKPAEKNGETAD